MFERKIPVEKIRAVVSRGGGIADADAPGVAKLTKYWIETSRTRMQREDESQTATLQVAATPGGTMDALALDVPQQAVSQPSDMHALLDQAQSASMPTSAPSGALFWTHASMCCCGDLGVMSDDDEDDIQYDIYIYNYIIIYIYIVLFSIPCRYLF